MSYESAWLYSNRPLIMAVLNVTPDSFYDGGRTYVSDKLDLDCVLRRVDEILVQGADIVDVGGESTRPGAAPVGEQEELDRVIPVIAAIQERFSTIVSVDTSSAKVIRESTKFGVQLINDVRALQQPDALEAAKESGAAICLMHMQGAPKTMQESPTYGNALREVYDFLQKRKKACVDLGVADEKIIVDPGIGFGKTDLHNLTLIRNLEHFTDLGPVLVGVSRKSMFGRLLGRELDQRLAGSLAVAMIAVQKGAKILRVHDVAETYDVLKIQQLIDQF